MFACRLGLFVLLLLHGVSTPQHAGAPIGWNEAQRQPGEWYASGEAARIADNVLLYQYPNGGWPKNVDLTRHIDPVERTRIRRAIEEEDPRRFPTTIDNGAAHRPARYLARVYAQTRSERAGRGFIRALDYLLEAQYENGGWPQFYPLRSGYHDHITFNDGAMIGVMRLLRDVARGHDPYAFVDSVHRADAQRAVDRGLEVILAAQVHIDGTPTVWCAQHDRYDLRPRQARSYEYPSLSGWESVEITRYLMEEERQTPRVRDAIEWAVAWYAQSKIEGIAVVEQPDSSLPARFDVFVVEDPSAPPLWARFYDLDTQRPIFADRDGTLHADFGDMEYERRVGYRWLGTWPQRLLDRDYPQWRARLGAQ